MKNNVTSRKPVISTGLREKQWGIRHKVTSLKEAS